MNLQLKHRWLLKILKLSVTALVVIAFGMQAFAQVPTYVPGGTLDPTTIPKYVTPLVIPPVMPKSTASPSPVAEYDIAVRQFKQQILPGGIWGSSFPNPKGGAPLGPIPATTVWSYGRAADPVPDSSAIPGGAAGVAPAANSSFNYPAFTVENTSGVVTTVRWINDLVDPGTGNFLPHLFNVDQTLHWANPPKANCIMGVANRTDCETDVPTPYVGPVPLVTHVHGAHVQPHSDGYPEAWWLPGAPGTKGIPAGYAERGTTFGQGNTANTVAGSAYFSYENTQPASTIWYHDHALGMTRLNVYAGPAGFWLIRGGANDTAAGVLPGPAPVAGDDPNLNPATRVTIREIPIVIQDRSFDLADAAGNPVASLALATQTKLFYPLDRTFFDGFAGPYIGGTGTPAGPSDISGIWNPEAFFNTIVVNGTTWPKFEVYPSRYRLRLLNGCNSRALNLSMFVVTAGIDGIFGTTDDVPGAEVPFYQIGGDQGFLPQVVKITKGFATPFPGNGTIPADVPAQSVDQALFLMSAERADVIVDFTGLATGTHVRIMNTAPDSPFGGFPVIAADLETTGQVMDFVVNTSLPVQPSDTASALPQNIVLPAPASLGAASKTRQVSLNEISSDQVCVEIQVIDGAIIRTLFSTFAGDPNFLTNCANAAVAPGNMSTPMGPRQAQLGVLTTSGANLISMPKRWGDPITETPILGDTEIWEIFNTTVDGHPIHLHLVGFEVINREDLDAAALALGNLVPTGITYPPAPNELGYKDTVLALPSQITRIKAKFDIPGLYVWHCHIVEHEDNEMMRPMIVNGDSLIYAANTGSGIWEWNLNTWNQITPNDPQLMAASGSTVYGSFAGQGIWKWSGANWTQITPNNPEKMTVAGTNLYCDFGTQGVWKWDGTAWSQVTPNNPDSMAAAGANLYGTFPGFGIWKYDGTTWSQLTPENPQLLVASGGNVYGAFSGFGIWKYDGTTWAQASPENPQLLTAAGTNLYGSFTGFGIWKWDGTAWSQVSPNSPQAMVAAGSFLFADFGATGIEKWDGATWNNLTATDPAIIVSGF